jgi:putative ABC transport system permease protein
MGSEDTVIADLKSQGINEKFYTWKDISGIMKSVTTSFSSINALLTLVGIIITAVTIFIVIYIDINNKRQQIGILRAIGIKPYLIDGMYILQSVVYSILGVILGLIIFFVIVVPYFKMYPFSLPTGRCHPQCQRPRSLVQERASHNHCYRFGNCPSVYITRMKLLNAIWGKYN